jgi:hypothetical protein
MYYLTSRPSSSSFSIEAPMFAPVNQEKQYSDVPDKRNLVFIYMVLFGIGSILPFNAMTTAIDFFNRHVSSYYYLKSSFIA